VLENFVNACFDILATDAAWARLPKKVQKRFKDRKNPADALFLRSWLTITPLLDDLKTGRYPSIDFQFYETLRRVLSSQNVIYVMDMGFGEGGRRRFRVGKCCRVGNPVGFFHSRLGTTPGYHTSYHSDDFRGFLYIFLFRNYLPVDASILENHIYLMLAKRLGVAKNKIAWSEEGNLYNVEVESDVFKSALSECLSGDRICYEDPNGFPAFEKIVHTGVLKVMNKKRWFTNNINERMTIHELQLSECIIRYPIPQESCQKKLPKKQTKEKVISILKLLH
jgi:hypothetical protein